MDQVSDSFYSFEETYHFSKYSCIRGFYAAHMVFNYLIAFSGLFAFLSRIGPQQLKWTHRWFGRIYIICMLWSTACSLLIHNTGLPEAVIWSFLWVLSGLCIGWILIVFHMQQMQQAATDLVEKKIANGETPFDLNAQINAAKGYIAANKTWKQRLFSWKTAHGVLMVVSYCNIIGRVLVTPLSHDFHCSTYPVYKPLGIYANLNHTAFVPGANPDYARTPWSKTGIPMWATLLCLGPMLGAVVVATVWSVIVSHKARRDSEYHGQTGADCRLT